MVRGEQETAVWRGKSHFFFFFSLTRRKSEGEKFMGLLWVFSFPDTEESNGTEDNLSDTQTHTGPLYLFHEILVGVSPLETPLPLPKCSIPVKLLILALVSGRGEFSQLPAISLQTPYRHRYRRQVPGLCSPASQKASQKSSQKAYNPNHSTPKNMGLPDNKERKYSSELPWKASQTLASIIGE